MKRKKVPVFVDIDFLLILNPELYISDFIHEKFWMKLCLTGLGLGSAALGQSTLYYKATILSWHRYQSRDNELRHRWELLITQLPAPSQDTGVPWCDHWPSPDHHQVSSDKMQSDRSRNLEKILLFCVCEWSEHDLDFRNESVTETSVQRQTSAQWCFFVFCADVWRWTLV